MQPNEGQKTISMKLPISKILIFLKHCFKILLILITEFRHPLRFCTGREYSILEIILLVTKSFGSLTTTHCSP